MMMKFTKTLTGKIILIFLMIAIPAVLSIFIYSKNVRDSWKEQRLLEIENDTSLRASAMDQLVSLLEETMVNLPFNNSAFEELQRYSKADTQAYWNTIVRIKQQLGTVQNIYGFLENIFIYYPEESFFLNNQVNPAMTAIIRDRVEHEEDLPPASWTSVPVGSRYYLYFLYPVKNYYLGMWASYDELLQHVCQQNNTTEKEYFLTGIGGMILTGTHAGEDIPAEQMNGISENEEITRVSKPVVHPGLYIFRQVETSTLELQKSWYTGSLLNVVALLSVLIAAILVSVSHWVLKPIKDITGGIEQISRGDIDHRLSVGKGASAEFEQISEEFNNMMNQLEHMQIRFYEQELEQKETKLRYLGQQVQPHFILNSLNTLYTYSNRDVDETRKIIRLLSGYYRYVVNIESRYVRLEEELEHLENYLSIQKIRFPNRLNYQIQCDEDAAVVPIPPFLLENFISNALKYGQNEDGITNIRIEAKQIEPFVIRITVSDDGQGFSDEVLEAINTYQKNGEKSQELGVGIANCMERLSLIYQDRAKICCFNRTNPETEDVLGASVEITISLTEKESSDSLADGKGKERNE